MLEQHPGTSSTPIRNNGDNHEDEGEGTVLFPLALEMEGGPPLTRPCVDCGLQTGRYCDGDEFGAIGSGGSACFADERLPRGDIVHPEWNPGQRTPLCSFCDKKYEACHFCRGVAWASPQPHQERSEMEHIVLAAQTEAISRLISLALRSGVDPNSVISQLKGISGPNPTWEDGQLILSTPDAIGRALETFLDGEETPNSKKKVQFEIAPDEVNAPQGTAKEYGQNCTECDGRGIVNEGGCLICKDCGWSKCE